MWGGVANQWHQAAVCNLHGGCHLYSLWECQFKIMWDGILEKFIALSNHFFPLVFVKLFMRLFSEGYLVVKSGSKIPGVQNKTVVGFDVVEGAI